MMKKHNTLIMAIAIFAIAVNAQTTNAATFSKQDICTAAGGHWDANECTGASNCALDLAKARLNYEVNNTPMVKKALNNAQQDCVKAAKKK